MELTLFRVEDIVPVVEVVQIDVKKGQFHDRTGKFANKLVSERDQAVREATGSKNRCNYLTSLVSCLRKQLRQKDERIIELEMKLKQK